MREMSYLRQRVNNRNGVKMLEVFTINSVNSVNTVVHHSGCEKVVKNRLGLRAVACYKSDDGINGLRLGGNNSDIALFVKFNKLFCLYWRQMMLNPSFVGNNCIEFDEVLDRDNSLYFAFYGLFNDGFANGMKLRVLIIGVNKDIGINQIYGQGIHCRVFPYQALVCLYARGGKPESSGWELSLLLFALVCSSFSDIRQSLLVHQSFLKADFLIYPSPFFVFQLVLALFQSPIFMFYLKLTEKVDLVNIKQLSEAD